MRLPDTHSMNSGEDRGSADDGGGDSRGADADTRGADADGDTRGADADEHVKASVLRSTLSIVRHNPRLVVFPMTAVVATIVVFPALLWSITRSLQAVSATLAGMFPVALPLVLAPALYVGIAASVAILASLLAIANAGIVQVTLDLIEGRSVSLRSGLAGAITNAPTMLIYGLFAGFVGLPAAIMERRSGGRGRYVFAAVAGETYTGMTYLLGPVAVDQRLTATGTLYRSARLLRAELGTHPVVSLTVLENVTIVAALPLVVVQTLLLAEVFGNFGLLAGLPGDALVTGFGLALAVLWVGVVAAMSLAAIAKTALYVAIRDDLDVLPLLDVPVEAAVTVKSTRDTPAPPGTPGSPEPEGGDAGD